jgi:hypothetical protein
MASSVRSGVAPRPTPTPACAQDLADGQARRRRARDGLVRLRGSRAANGRAATPTCSARGDGPRLMPARPPLSTTLGRWTSPRRPARASAARSSSATTRALFAFGWRWHCARLNGPCLFRARRDPGDRVRAVVTKRKAVAYAEARTVALLEPGPGACRRSPPRRAVAGAPYERQLEVKAERSPTRCSEWPSRRL